MIKKLISLIILFFLLGCSGLEFVYNQNIISNHLDNKVIVAINGDDRSEIALEIKRGIKENKDAAEYLLEINSTKNEKNQAILEDGTASKVVISHSLNYSLKNISNNCIIMEKLIVTSSTFDSKSSGYNFGTDISAKEVKNQNIKENINKFYNYLERDFGQGGCIDED